MSNRSAGPKRVPTTRNQEYKRNPILNAADAQTCTYVHDDLARIASVDCGASKWQQNFSYDVFGNLKKAVPTGGTGISWQPNSDATTNRYSAIAGVTPVYDNNGNLTSDGFGTHAWVAENRSKAVGSVTLIYDALGREVEEQDAGVNTEFVYYSFSSLREGLVSADSREALARRVVAPLVVAVTLQRVGPGVP